MLGPGRFDGVDDAVAINAQPSRAYPGQGRGGGLWQTLGVTTLGVNHAVFTLSNWAHCHLGDGGIGNVSPKPSLMEGTYSAKM